MSSLRLPDGDRSLANDISDIVSFSQVNVRFRIFPPES
jgi:hypothetical protein